MTRQAPQQVDHQALRLNPIAHGIRRQLQSPRAQVLATALIVGAIAMAPGQSSAQEVLEEIIVTAQKRDQNLQDVPISVTVLSATKIKDLGITSFDDYMQMLPTVSYKTAGPGTGQVVMRGAADGGNGNVSGSQPSVAIYLDEAPLTSIGMNIDVHIYDIERIEALAGPQGTLFGASSQSGTLRLITNKPDPSGFEGGVDLGASGTSGGDASYSAEGFVNIPVGETAAIRLVAYAIEEGGYIDNVPGTRSYFLEGGYGYNPNSFGRVATLDNSNLVKDNFNELSKTGLRAALKVDLSDSWTGSASLIYQDMETEGTWDHDPTNVGEGNIQRFFEDFRKEDFVIGSWTLDGEVGNHQLVYTGSHMDRDVQYQSDYTAYGEDAYWVPYYVCDYSASGADLITQSNTDCTSLAEYYTTLNDYKRTTHELRLQSLGDGRFHYVLGAYFDKSEHAYFQQWVQPGISSNQAIPGGRPNVFFRTDQERTEEQTAFFGELTYDLTDSVSITGGARFFDNDSKLTGVVGWGPVLFGNADTAVDEKVGDKDQIFKANLTWQIDEDRMLYVTVSEGYRPGGLNRDPGLQANGLLEYTPDILTNYEIGFKSTLADGRLRFNAALYTSDWEDVQYTIYDFSLSRCCGSVYNIGDAEIVGFEFDAAWAASDTLTLSAAAAFNDGETKGDKVLFTGTLRVPDGTELPNVPDFKGNLVARWDFDLGGFDTFAQAAYSYQGSSYNEIRPDQRTSQDSYGILNLRAGINQGKWGVDAYVNNVTDEVAQIYVSPRPYEPSTTTNRPLSYGLKYWVRF